MAILVPCTGCSRIGGFLGFSNCEPVRPDDRTAVRATNSSLPDGHSETYFGLLVVISFGTPKADGRRPDILACPPAICHLPFAILESVDSVDLNARRSRSDYFFACPSANAWSKSRPGDLKPIFSLTKRAASAAPYSRSMPGSSHSTESGPA